MTHEIRVFSLPGFLGMPSDWKGVLAGMRDIWHIPCDFYDETFTHPQEGFWAWGRSFNKFIEEKYGPSNAYQSNILLGYSLGGRLGMHALVDNPSLWRSSVLVSTHPGLDWHNEKVLRRQRDHDWAKRFASDSWESVMRTWNEQPIFKHDKHSFIRNEKDYNRSLLTSTLTSWSLSAQDNLRLAMQKLYLPVFWIAGENDERFTYIAKFMRLHHPASRVWIVPSSGHRVPWNQYELFNQELNQFFQHSILASQGDL